MKFYLDKGIVIPAIVVIVLGFSMGFGIIWLSSNAYAKRLQPEKYYQAKWCAKVSGQTEVVLEDKTRVDCMTWEYVYEFDFADKWAEAIGQALHYSVMTGKKPGIVLIVEDKKSHRYWYRLKKIIKHYNLPINLRCYVCSGLEGWK